MGRKRLAVVLILLLLGIPFTFGEEYPSSSGFESSVRSDGTQMQSVTMERVSGSNSGYNYEYSYASPSFEGQSNEKMVRARLFSQLDSSINSEILDHCDDPEKTADVVYENAKRKISDFEKLCGAEDKCGKISEHCDRIGSWDSMGSSTGVMQKNAFACPPDRDVIINACKLRVRSYLSDKADTLREQCEFRVQDDGGERFFRECEVSKETLNCDRASYIEKCIAESGIPEPRDSSTSDGTTYPTRCPTVYTKECPAGQVLKPKQDNNGCTYYECVSDNPQTSDGTTYSTRCPTVYKRECPAGQVLKPKQDNNGCTYYVCVSDDNNSSDQVASGNDGNSYPTRCPTVYTKECLAGEVLKTRQDNNGCTYYECVSDDSSTSDGTPYSTQCPTVYTKECPAGQVLKPKQDNNGCTYYECVSDNSSSTGSNTGSGSGNDGTSYSSSESVQTSSIQASNVVTTNMIRARRDVIADCEREWNDQKRDCERISQGCDKSALVDRCVRSEKKSQDELHKRMIAQCASDSLPEFKSAEKRCARINEEREKCVKLSRERCERFAGSLQSCREQMSEERIKEFILNEVKKRCRLMGLKDDIQKEPEVVYAVLNTASKEDIAKIEEIVRSPMVELELEDTVVYKGMMDSGQFGDLKLLPFVRSAKLLSDAGSQRSKNVKTGVVADTAGKKVVVKLASLRESNIPDEFVYLIEDNAAEVLDASESFDEVAEKESNKGFGYSLKRFFGLAKKAEESEIAQLRQSREKLDKSIEGLQKLQGEVPDDVVKAVLNEQVELLQEQKGDIEKLIVEKESKAKGLFSIFG